MRCRRVLIPIILAALPLTACQDDDTYPLPVDAIKNRLSGKVLTYFYKDNKILMRFDRGPGNSVVVMQRGKLWIAKCRLLLEAVDEASTRLIPDCGDSDNQYRQEALDIKEREIAEKAKEVLGKSSF